MNLNFTLVLQILSFLVLLSILMKVLYRPLMKFLDERAETMKDALEEAKKQRLSADANLKKSEELLAGNRKEIIAIKEAAVCSADNMMRKAVEESKKEAHAVLEKSRREIEEEVNSAKASIKKDLSKIAVDIAQKILEREVNEKDHKKLIDESLKEMK